MQQSKEKGQAGQSDSHPGQCFADIQEIGQENEGSCRECPERLYAEERIGSPDEQSANIAEAGLNHG